MKKILFILLLSGLASLCLPCSLLAQTCTFPTQMEKDEIVLCVSVKDGKFVLKTSRSASLFQTVKFRVLLASNTPCLVRISDSGFLWSSQFFVSQSNTVNTVSNIPIGNYKIEVVPISPSTTPKASNPKGGKLQIKAITPNGNYVKPDVTWRIETANAINPAQVLGFTPDMTMFPTGTTASILSVSKGIGHAYVRYAPQNNGQIKKPIIFVDGVDFETEKNNYYDKSVNGTFLESDLIRHGDTGWDIFSMGAEDGFNDNPSITETFREYPNVFKTLSDKGYDIIFLDFAEGATYIQKNVEVFKALLRKIKQEKVGSYPNTVVGPSMGGQISRIGLAEMERDKEDHCTSLYVSFDSPHQGANIPLGIQAMAWAASTIDLEKDQWRKLNYPAARQLLVEHLANAAGMGRIKLEIDVVSPPGALGIPVGPTLLKKSSNVYKAGSIPPSDLGQFRSKYVELLNNVGYPKKTNNIAIANGNIEGLGQGFGGGNDLLKGFIQYEGVKSWSLVNIPKLSIGQEVADDLNINAAVDILQGTLAIINPIQAHLALNALIPANRHRVFDLDINAVPGSPTKVFNHHSCTGFSEDKSHLHLSTGEGNVIFHLAAPTETDILLGNEIPCEYKVLKATIQPQFVSTFLNYDNAPGGGRRDLKSIQSLIEDTGATSSTAPIIESTNQNLLQCFIPSFSALDIQLPVNNTNLSTLHISNAINANRSITPFEQVKGKIEVQSLRHVEVDEDIKNWVNGALDQYQEDLSLAGELPNNGQNTYNYGLWRKRKTNTKKIYH